MIPVEPSYCADADTRVVFAKAQAEYFNLPATISPEGIVTTEWELNAEEIATLVIGGRVRILLHTFNQPLQPLRVDVAEAACGFRES